MDRVDEAFLALVGSAEARGEPLSASSLSCRPDDSVRVTRLLRADLLEVDGEHLRASVSGWRFLDGRGG